MLAEDEKKDHEDSNHEEGEEESPVKARKNVFVLSDDHAWLPARIVEQTNDKEAVVQVFDLDGATRETTVQLRDYPPQNALPLKNVNEYGDMIDLPFLHEPGILYNLRTRFMNDRPYTRTGDILIAVNPYQWLDDIYTNEKRKHYMPDNIYDPASGMVKKSSEPHVYEVSAMAFRGLAHNQKNQSILVSGESGAGKTETVKICLDHIATIQGGLKRQGGSSDSKQNGQHQVMSDIVQRVVDSNPLLEAFGNAKTVRNDNSSRFGKFVQLQFDQSSKTDDSNNCTLVGSHIEVYLLEKSRVVSHAAGERNFHIFYQLLAAPDNIKRKIDADVLIGKTPASFPYLGSRDKTGMKVKRRRSSVGASAAAAATDTQIIDNMSDAQWFEQTVKELEIIGIKDEMLWMLLRALCVVLQLGKIDFVADDDDHAKIPDPQITKGGEFAKLANLMGIETDVLCKAFTNKTIMAGSTEIHSPLSPQQAKEGCDAYAKDLYSKTFMWLVGTINAATSASEIHSKKNGVISTGDASNQEHGMIGVLDIFGFEAFEQNHFEQLCINYANERLQNMFANNVFVSLIDEYAREGLVVDFSYETNTNVLDLIAGKTGILATLNEECIRPGGSDVEFVFKTFYQNKKSPRMFKTDLFTAYQFGIRHFAGPVVYTAKDFLSTNKDIMPIDLQTVSRSSTNTIIAADYVGPGASGGGAGPRSRSNMTKNTVVSKFRTQLNSLMKTLSATKTHYIRCIKPNGMKQPRHMENLEILRQLRSGGVIAAIKIASASYPNKMEHHAVLKRFRNLGSKPDSSQDVNTQVSTLLATALKDFISPIKGGTPRPPTTLGKTRVYFRTGALEYLENARNDNIGFFAIIIQRSYRMFPIRRAFLKQRNAAITIQALGRGFVWKRRVEKMPDCALTIQCWYRCAIAKKRLNEHKSAAIIQRRWCAVREIIRFERRTKAAILVQKIVRGSVQRPKFQFELMQKTRAVVHFQKMARGFIQLGKFRVVFEQKRLKEKQAAIQIQRVARGYNQRIRYQVALEELFVKKTHAVVHFQRIARGYMQVVKFRAMQKAEQERIAEEKAAEEKRIAAKKAAKEARLRAERLAVEKAAEEERLAAEKAAEEARLEEERLAAEEKARLKAEKARKKEEKRLRAEKKAEKKRLKEERARLEEEKRLAAEKRAEEERLEAERIAAEEVRLKAEKLATKERLEAEKKVEEERLEAERVDAENRSEQEGLQPKPVDIEKVLLEERLAAAEKRVEEERLKAERRAAEKEALEQRLAAAEKRAEEERINAERRATENAGLKDRISVAMNGGAASEENAAIERAIQAAQEKAAADNAAKEEPENDEELELALEMALLAGQNPDVPPEELNKLLGKPSLDTNSSIGGLFSRLAGGLRSMATANTWSSAPTGVVVAAPWGGSDNASLGNFLASTGGRSRAGNRDDDTFAESVSTMMLPDSLTVGQLRSRRENLRVQQEMRKMKKKVSEDSRELRKLRRIGEKAGATHKEQKRVLTERLEAAKADLENRLQRLPYDDRDTDLFAMSLEKASVDLGLGSFEEQKQRMNEDEMLQFEVQVLQEGQLVRQMQQMHVVGQQRFLHKKNYQRDVEYLKSCETWLSDHAAMKDALRQMWDSVEAMKTMYEATLRRQEAAFARHDADMTIRESIEDIF